MQIPETGRLETIPEEKVLEMRLQGRAVFQVGEIVTVNGGRFRVRKITKKDIILRGIPAIDACGGDLADTAKLILSGPMMDPSQYGTLAVEKK